MKLITSLRSYKLTVIAHARYYDLSYRIKKEVPWMILISTLTRHLRHYIKLWSFQTQNSHKFFSQKNQSFRVWIEIAVVRYRYRIEHLLLLLLFITFRVIYHHKVECNRILFMSYDVWLAIWDKGSCISLWRRVSGKDVAAYCQQSMVSADKIVLGSFGRRVLKDV